MPEIRQNLATREWVIIATERARRPEQFILPSRGSILDRPEYDPNCPFCPGNEELDLERFRLPATGDWQVRVVRNRYPALLEYDEYQRRFHGINRSLAGFGYHDIVVESRRHNTCAALEPVEGLITTLQAFQTCASIYRRDPRIEHIVFFKTMARLRERRCSIPTRRRWRCRLFPTIFVCGTRRRGATSTTMASVCSAACARMKNGNRIASSSAVAICGVHSVCRVFAVPSLDRAAPPYRAFSQCDRR